MKLFVFSVSSSALRRLHSHHVDGGPQVVAVSLGSERSPVVLQEALRSIEEPDFVLLDLMGAKHDDVTEIVRTLGGRSGPLVVVNTDSAEVRFLTHLGGFSLRRAGERGAPGSAPEGSIAEGSPEAMLRMVKAMEKIGRTLPIGPLRDARNYIWIGRYWLFPTTQNVESFLRLVGREYFSLPTLAAPLEPGTPRCPAIALPDGRTFDSLSAYVKAFPRREGQRSVCLLYAAGTYPLDTHDAAQAVVERMQERFFVLPVAMAYGEAATIRFLRSLLLPDGRGKPAVDCLVNLVPFRFGQGPMGGNAEEAVTFLRDLDVPYLHPFFMSKRSKDEWEGDMRGLDGAEFVLHYFLPELDGASTMLPLGATAMGADGLAAIVPLHDRIERLLDRTERLIRLRHTPNAAKRLAILLYDYPPGEANAGGAAFLDTFTSVSRILSALAEAGYGTHAVSAGELRRLLVEEGRCNDPTFRGDPHASGSLHVDRVRYARLTEGCPREESVTAAWGGFPGPVMAVDGGIVLQLLEVGNVVIGFQPSRRPGERDDTASWHDQTLPPHHHYVAFYRYLEKELSVDAVIHVGTHGTLEFLPGKELAPSSECFPDYLIGAMPHFYLYYVGNPSEAMIAKHKTHAVMIGHMQPPYARSGLYGELGELAALREEYDRARIVDPGRQTEILSDIDGHLRRLGWPWEGVDALDERLFEIAHSLIPSGLHVFGDSLSTVGVRSFLCAFLREDREECPSLIRILAARRGLDYGELMRAPSRFAGEWRELETEAEAWIDRNVMAEHPPTSGGPAEESAIRAVAQGIARTLRTSDEIPALLHCLSGGYLTAGLAGDPLRSADVLPTGRNLHQFDPRRAPTPSAVRRGKGIAEATIAAYVGKNGGYPRHIAVVLWGLETSKTEGETVAAVLHYLGVRLRPRRDVWNAPLELVPLTELGRPRIDVTMQISGFFRDLFPNLVELLDRAVLLAERADEADQDNGVRASSRSIFERLVSGGQSEENARRYASVRLFGPRPGTYGTGITAMVHAGSWRQESEIAANYMESMQFAYSESLHGVEAREALACNLSSVDVVSQVRASGDYELTDLDHFYEHLGGLASSVEQTAGRKAEVLVSDSYEGRIRTEGVEKAVQRGVRARLLNPLWLDGALRSDFHGAQQVSQRLENLVGLAATTKSVDNRIFEDAADRLAIDPVMRERLKANNPYALREIYERLLEAAGRGYWGASAEKLEEIRRLARELEDELE
ncbi:MAG TPA: cobaltochelatase subunit CobN [Spirochaetia bacterium]